MHHRGIDALTLLSNYFAFSTPQLANQSAFNKYGRQHGFLRGRQELVPARQKLRI